MKSYKLDAEFLSWILKWNPKVQNWRGSLTSKLKVKIWTWVWKSEIEAEFEIEVESWRSDLKFVIKTSNSDNIRVPISQSGKVLGHQVQNIKFLELTVTEPYKTHNSWLWLTL